ncbi:MAG: terpene cyclase/mutase family protein [bacterium]|nr:terpene cyclase/mutase family protein [bacterium]
MSKHRTRTVRSVAALGLTLVATGFGAFSGSSVANPDPVTPLARTTAEDGIRWLLAVQNHDGSWGRDKNLPGEVGNTAVVALALMAHGSTPSRGPHWRAVRAAVDWLRPHTRGYGSNRRLDSETLLQRKLGAHAPLYFSTLFYAQVLGSNADRHEDEIMRQDLKAMIAHISSLQREDGQWETSYEPMLTTITAWLALKQASSTGIAIDQASPKKVVEYLMRCLEKPTGIFREAKWGNRERFVTQSGGVRVLHGENLGHTKEAKKAANVIAKMRFDQDVGGRQGGEEFLGALFAVQALLIERDANYFNWYPRIVKALKRCQDANGSWVGHHCITDRVFCTSCAVMTLLTPDKLVPMSER